jgi:hypothetical protein
MPKLSEELKQVVQRTGSNTGRLQTDSERAAFAANVRSDLAQIVGQHNAVVKPIFDSLISEPSLDALEGGLVGNVLLTHGSATVASATAYWNATLGRARTVKETVDVLLSEISRLENEIRQSVDVAPYDDTTVLGLIGVNQSNLQQLKLDTVGSNYTFDNDGVADNTYPLSQHLDAIGAFFTGFPGSGNTYPASPVYPTLSFEVLLSNVTLDTTIPQSTVTGLSNDLGYIRTFIGMDTTGPETPTYSAHGAITHVSDGTSLEVAIQALDSAVASGVGAFATTANVTRNSPGDYNTDDFVFGSPTLDDDTISTHDDRMLFDKSRGAFRVGGETGANWDEANRGSYSFVAGINSSAISWNSIAMGQECSVRGLNSVIASGFQNDIFYPDRISATDFSGTAYGNGILTGWNNDLYAEQLTPSGLNTEAGTIGTAIVGGINNSIQSLGVAAFIGAGKGNTIVNAAKGAGYVAFASAIVAGQNNTIGDTAASDVSFIGGGSANSVNSGFSLIIGGEENAVSGGDYQAIGGGKFNIISSSGAYNVIAGGGSTSLGDGNEITGTATQAAIVGGHNNTISVNGGFIGGGQDNDISSSTGSISSIVGGASNSIAGTSTFYAFIGGGQLNTIDGTSTHSSIPGGESNTITSADHTVVAGGFSNAVTSTGGYNAVGGGASHIISGTVSYAAIAGGLGNDSTSGNYNSILGGRDNWVLGDYSSIVGGQENKAIGDYSVALGYQTETTVTDHAVIAHSGGQFSVKGDAQTNQVVWRIQTTDATAAVEMFLDGASARYSIITDSTHAFEVLVVARRTDTDNESAAYKFTGCIDNNAGTTALVGSVTKTVIAEDVAGWDCDIVADDTNDALKVQVTGAAASTVNWLAYGRIVKVIG